MLVKLNSFIRDKNYVGGNILYPKQKEILLEFWNNPYQVGVWCLGRRSGKTFMAALSAVFACVALAPIYRKFIRDGEKFYILFVANNREQAGLALKQTQLFLETSAILRGAIAKLNATSIELNNGAVFKVLPNTSEGVRGYPSPLIILDEAAFYGSGSDKKRTGEQLLQAIEPSIAQFREYGRLLMISTPWDKQGVFYTNYQKALSGAHPEIHAVNFPTWEVNPRISKKFLSAAKRRDPLMFEVEYGANFAVDFSAFLDTDKVRDAVQLPGPVAKPSSKYRYFLALDPALSGDAFTAGIGHLEDSALVIDLLYEFIPSYYSGKAKKVVDIAAVEQWILQQHKSFKFQKIVLDQYQSQATIQRLQRELGISKISEFTWTQKSKIEAYSYLKELFNSDRIKLYPHEVTITQLINLQVIYGAGGRWSVTGGTGLKVDDYCSVIAALAIVSKEQPRPKWANFKLQ